jgi:acyl carrier protein
MSTPVPVRTVILDQIKEIASLQRKHLVPLDDAVPLLESGLDSLCIAILVAQLEDETGLDPFSAGDASIPVTLGDFIRLYENAAG